MGRTANTHTHTHTHTHTDRVGKVHTSHEFKVQLTRFKMNQFKVLTKLLFSNRSS